MVGINLPHVNLVDLPTIATNNKFLFFDDVDGKLKVKDENGNIEIYVIESFISAGDGINILSGVISADINTTNLKFTSNEINTIQDISTSSSPTFDTLTVTNNITVDTDTLHVDSNNHRVGIGTTNPVTLLHINSGTGGDAELRIEADTDNNQEDDNPRIVFVQDGGEQQAAIFKGNNALTIANSVGGSAGIIFSTGTIPGYLNAVERMRIDKDGDIFISGVNLINLIEYVTKSETTTLRVLALTDRLKFIEMNNAATQTVEVPPNSSVAFPVGTTIQFVQLGAGAVVFSEGIGVTINSRAGLLEINSQYGGATLRKTGTDTWILIGDLA